LDGRASDLSDTVFCKTASTNRAPAELCNRYLKGEVAMEVNFAGGSRGTKDVGYTFKQD
jgi:hypothetical protein